MTNPYSVQKDISQQVSHLQLENIAHLSEILLGKGVSVYNAAV